MRVGSVVYDSSQGLSYLARSFYDAGVVNEVVIMHHRTRPPVMHYPGATRLTGNWAQDRRPLLQFCEKMDAMLFFETPHHWAAIDHCRSKGIKTFLVPMMECLPPVAHLPYQPDLFICPSLLDLDYFPNKSVYLPVPVTGVKWRRRDRARVFVHNAGNLGLLGRNGTAELVQAIRYMKSPAQVIIRSQKPLPPSLRVEIDRHPSRVVHRYGEYPYERLYEDGDVFLFPEKFNGLSLPLQEALGSGMLVMATDRFPSNTYLPTEPLIPVAGSRRNRVSPRCAEFDEAIIEPQDIAECVDSWYDRDCGEFSDRGREYAEANSWEVLKPRYMRALRGEVG